MLPSAVAMVASTALNRAFRSSEAFVLSNIPVKDRGGIEAVGLRVKPFDLTEDAAERIRGLKQELPSRGENLQATIGFTPAAASFVNIIPRDVGRSITHLSTNIDYASFLDDVRAVFERPVQSGPGADCLSSCVYPPGQDGEDVAATVSDGLRRVLAGGIDQFTVELEMRLAGTLHVAEAEPVEAAQ